MQSMSHQIEEWPWQTPLMLRAESPRLPPIFEVNAGTGTGRRFNQDFIFGANGFPPEVLSGLCLLFKYGNVLFGPLQFECSRVHSGLFVYLLKRNYIYSSKNRRRVLCLKFTFGSLIAFSRFSFII